MERFENICGRKIIALQNIVKNVKYPRESMPFKDRTHCEYIWNIDSIWNKFIVHQRTEYNIMGVTTCDEISFSLSL